MKYQCVECGKFYPESKMEDDFTCIYCWAGHDPDQAELCDFDEEAE